jgi:hypothetical protein
MTERLKTVGVRLEVNMLNYVKEISKLLHLDKSSALRMLLREGITVDRKERALDLYTSGKLSLEGAAKFANLYIGDFLDLMQERGIESQVSLDMVKKGKENLKSA